MKREAARDRDLILENVVCDFCGADDATLVFRAKDTNYHFEGEFSVVRCRVCDLTYLNPRPDVQTLGAYYPADEYACYVPTEDPKGLSSNHPFSRAVRSLDIGTGSVCDIGCGIGTFLVAAQNSGWAVTGIEPNDKARRLCHDRLGTEVVFPSLEAASFGPASFDVVTLWHVLEHLPSPRQTLQEIHRLLKDEGILVLAVPNFDSLERHIWGPNWVAVMAPTHLYHFTESTLGRHVRSCGYEIQALHQGPGSVSLAANLLRTLRRFLLDPLAGRKPAGCSEIPAGATGEGPRRHASYWEVQPPTKAKVVRAVRTSVKPLAWMIAELRLGPALILSARKVGMPSPGGSVGSANTTGLREGWGDRKRE